VIRSIITNDLTNQTSKQLVDLNGRQALEQQILRDITAKTDDKVTAVLFTDVAVQ
jgi:flagellar basal body-associated protein FliL